MQMDMRPGGSVGTYRHQGPARARKHAVRGVFLGSEREAHRTLCLALGDAPVVLSQRSIVKVRVPGRGDSRPRSRSREEL